MGYFSTEYSTHINPLRIPVSMDYVANIEELTKSLK